MGSVPLHIVSGFLGSGKTTFLKEILRQIPDGIKTGIIQNEFAPVNTDKHEIAGAGGRFELLEVNNGSLFCVCLLGDFIHSLVAFIEQHSPGLLILEASGLADTTSVTEMVMSPLLRDKIHLSSNWCIVDAVNFMRSGKMFQRIIHQIRMADVVLINKCDLAEAALPVVGPEIRKLNPYAAVHHTTFCRIPVDFGRIPVPGILKTSQTPLGRPDLFSMVIKSTRRFSAESLHSFLQIWSPRAYRIKGYAALESHGAMAVQSVMGSFETRTAPDWKGNTELIALSSDFQLNEWNNSFRQHAY